MNNEEIKEAIETLERNYPFDRYVQLKKAVDVAIEALHTVNSPTLIMKRLGEFQADVIMQSGKDTDVPVTDCISRQQALALEKELMVNERGYEKYNHGLNSYRTKLMSLPSAEPDVIRCKDCKYLKHDTIFNQAWCSYPNPKGTLMVFDDSSEYCSRAEREFDGR